MKFITIIELADLSSCYAARFKLELSSLLGKAAIAIGEVNAWLQALAFY